MATAGAAATTRSDYSSGILLFYFFNFYFFYQVETASFVQQLNAQEAFEIEILHIRTRIR